MDGPGVVAADGCSAEVREYLERVVELFTAGDLDRITDVLVTEDVEFHDHRPLGPDPIIGSERARVWLDEMLRMMPDWQVRIEVLEQSGDVYLARDTYFGHGTEEGVGAAELEWYVVDVLRGGKLAREEIFEHQEQAREAYDRLLGR